MHKIRIILISVLLIGCESNSSSQSNQQPGLTPFEQIVSNEKILWERAVNSSANCPVNIITCEILPRTFKESNGAVSKLLLVGFNNTSKSKMKAVKFIVKGFNNWDEAETIGYSVGNLKVFEDQNLPKNLEEMNTYTIWNLNVTHVKAYLVKIYFEDGTLWEAK